MQLTQTGKKLTLKKILIPNGMILDALASFLGDEALQMMPRNEFALPYAASYALLEPDIPTVRK
jgi:hypothetical protein